MIRLLRLLNERPEWMRWALCAQISGADLFYPEKGEGVAVAKRICSLCEVRSPCLAYAVERTEDHGVWGGLSAAQRRKLRRLAAVAERPDVAA